MDWAKRSDESGPAYAAFCRYRDLGPERTLEEAFRQATGRPGGVVRASGRWHTWSRDYSWVKRAAAYDAFLADEARRKADAATIARRAKMLERHRQAAELLTQRGVQFFAKNEVEKANDAITAIVKGVDLERQAEGLPSYVVEILNANAERLDDILAEVEGRLAACESTGDRAALGAGSGVETAAASSNGKH